jgi:hypothetical protein
VLATASIATTSWSRQLRKRIRLLELKFCELEAKLAGTG